ncbi:hypothetical protein QN277_017638 [Acacia crassicarpa]|uniref:Uncharacterized protein n=1 Tax=Acacia crassicarpa TaxID=499986 RepID=A0AAE1MU80_9FABA|nr:hypothetical protein QN277_017638 [Acacia crassicarpa]
MTTFSRASVGGLHGLLPKVKHDASLFQVWLERTLAVSKSEHELPNSCCDITVTWKSSSRLSGGLCSWKWHTLS